MKIIFVGTFGLQLKGTMSVRALPLAKALVRRGHAVTMLIPPWDDPARAGQHWYEDGVEIINVSLPPKIVGLFHLWLTATLVAHVLRWKPDVVHCFKPKAYAGLSHFVLWWWRKLGFHSFKLVVDTDDWEQAWNEVSPYSAMQKKFFAWQEQWGICHADAVTVASRALVQLVQQKNSKVFYLPNGCRSIISKIAPAEVTAVRQQWQLGDAPTVLLYSRFLEFRLTRLVNLVQAVAAEIPTARWLMVGRGLHGEDETLKIKLSEANLSEYVRFVGWVTMEQLPSYFQAADVAIFPYDDTLINRTKCSVKLIDLLSVGLVVVADAVGQNNEYIQNGQSGILVPAEDDVAFGKAINQLLQQPTMRHSLGQAAQQQMQENFNWSQLAQIAEQAYDI